MEKSIVIIIALWLIYGFLGFLIETTYVSTIQRKVVQRGFLSGPIIPIYAFGAMTIVLLLGKQTNVLLVFVLGVVLASILEYITHYLMEKFLHLTLWDYSDKKINLKGRICLENGLMFGALAVLLVFIVNPPLEAFLYRMNPKLLGVLVLIGALVTIADTTLSTLAALNIKAKMKTMSTPGMSLDTEQFKAQFNELESKYKLIKRRLVKAYPNIQTVHLHEVFDDLKEKYRHHPKVIRKNKDSNK